MDNLHFIPNNILKFFLQSKQNIEMTINSDGVLWNKPTPSLSIRFVQGKNRRMGILYRAVIHGKVIHEQRRLDDPPDGNSKHVSLHKLMNQTTHSYSEAWVKIEVHCYNFLLNASKNSYGNYDKII